MHRLPAEYFYVEFFNACKILYADLVERLYRSAILNAPSFESSYKNLGLLLWNNDGSTSEIISLWEHYIQLVPNDPENEAIKSALETLKEQQ